MVQINLEIAVGLFLNNISIQIFDALQYLNSKYTATKQIENPKIINKTKAIKDSSLISEFSNKKSCLMNLNKN